MTSSDLPKFVWIWESFMNFVSISNWRFQLFKQINTYLKFLLRYNQAWIQLQLYFKYTVLESTCLYTYLFTNTYVHIMHRRRKYGGSSPNSLRPISYFGSIWELYVLDPKNNVFCRKKIQLHFPMNKGLTVPK